jgi:hypothetical protein
MIHRNMSHDDRFTNQDELLFQPRCTVTTAAMNPNISQHAPLYHHYISQDEPTIPATISRYSSHDELVQQP